jgi:hypothetical protein
MMRRRDIYKQGKNMLKDLDMEAYNFADVDGSLVRDLDGIHHEIKRTGYDQTLESKVADRIVSHLPRVWGARHSFSLRYTDEIRPRLVELVLSMKMLEEFTYASNSSSVDDRLRFIATTIATPVKYLEAITKYEADVKSQKAEENDEVRGSVFRKYRPNQDPLRFVSELAVSLMGTNVVADSVFKKNMVRRKDSYGQPIVDANQLNALVYANLNKLRQNADQKTILTTEEKFPRRISELSWVTFVDKDARIKGLRQPFMKVGDVELAAEIYACPQEALNYAVSEPTINQLTERVQDVYDVFRTTKKTCLPELLLLIDDDKSPNVSRKPRKEDNHSEMFA